MNRVTYRDSTISCLRFLQYNLSLRQLYTLWLEVQLRETKSCIGLKAGMQEISIRRCLSLVFDSGRHLCKATPMILGIKSRFYQFR
jgi:hypothetical protein